MHILIKNGSNTNTPVLQKKLKKDVIKILTYTTLFTGYFGYNIVKATNLESEIQNTKLHYEKLVDT